MPNNHQYVPVLRWKSAERKAVRMLSPTVKKKLLPLIEFVPSEFGGNSLESTLQSKAKEIATMWGWSDRFVIDFALLGEEKGARSVPLFVEAAEYYNLKFTLVTGLHRPPAHQAALRAAANRGAQVCLRIFAHELRQSGFRRTIESLLQLFQLTRDQVDLVIDFQAMTEPAASLASCIAQFPDAGDWRSLTITAGAFPKDLSHLEKNRQHLLPRADWLEWRAFAETFAGRIPSFGDYTVQHGTFYDQEGKVRNFSASIRYTSGEHWVIMRGEGVRNEDSPGYQQYPANAMLLCERPEFCGAEFSFGDHYIKEMSEQSLKTGGPKEWLAAAINHHLTFVARQLDQLPDGSGNTSLSSGLNPNLHTPPISHRSSFAS